MSFPKNPPILALQVEAELFQCPRNLCNSLTLDNFKVTLIKVTTVGLEILHIAQQDLCLFSRLQYIMLNLQDMHKA